MGRPQTNMMLKIAKVLGNPIETALVMNFRFHFTLNDLLHTQADRPTNQPTDQKKIHL